jgi:hypothetical protein
LVADSAYTDRLVGFGYSETDLFKLPSGVIAVARRLTPHLSLVGELVGLDGRTYSQQSDPTKKTYDWTSTAVGLYLRASYPLAGGRVEPFVQAGLGIATTGTTMSTIDGRTNEEMLVGDRGWGYLLHAAAGVSVMPWRQFGFWARAAWYRAPTLSNLLGEGHDVGGLWLGLGIKGAL